MGPRHQHWHRIQGAVDGYAAGIVRLIGESYGRDTVQQAWQEFTSGAGETFCGDDPHTELFFSWLFHRWSPTRAKGNRVKDFSLYGVPPTRAYLNRNSSHLVPLEGATMLEAISPLSFPPVFKRHLARLCRRRKLVDPADRELQELYFTFTKPGQSRPTARMH
jgi:hypothetical protein